MPKDGGKREEAGGGGGGAPPLPPSTNSTLATTEAAGGRPAVCGGTERGFFHDALVREAPFDASNVRRTPCRESSRVVVVVRPLRCVQKVEEGVCGCWEEQINRRNTRVDERGGHIGERNPKSVRCMTHF